MESPTRALFVNSGMAGHQTFARLMKAVASQIPSMQAEHIDLTRDLTVGDRVIRRALSVAIAPTEGPAANLDLRRWRQELNAGWLASRRIAAAERRAGRFDLLHFYTQPAAYGSIGLMRERPAIVCLDCTQRQAALEAGSGLSRASYRAGIVHDGRVLRAASAIVALSEWASRDLVDLYPDCAGRVHVLPCPVDVREFDASWMDERAARAALPGYRPRALFIGGGFRRKGGLDLLAAWRDSGLGALADLDLVTDWPLDAADLPPAVTLVRGVAAYSDRWLALWRRADLFVLPTEHEAFGIVFGEAAAAGLPAIGTRINAIPEIVRDGVTGLLVEPGDRAGLAASLGTLVSNAGLRDRLGRAARHLIAGRASISVYAAHLESLVDSLVHDDVRHPA
jgi:glycosyltransferase involved in cell wall biosynthesis